MQAKHEMKQIVDMLPKITLIDEPGDVTPSKLLPYSMVGLAGLLILLSFTHSPKKEEEEVGDEELEEEEENDQEVK